MNISPGIYHSTLYIKLDPIPDVGKACIRTGFNLWHKVAEQKHHEEKVKWLTVGFPFEIRPLFNDRISRFSRDIRRRLLRALCYATMRLIGITIGATFQMKSLLKKTRIKTWFSSIFDSKLSSGIRDDFFSILFWLMAKNH